MTRTTYEQVLLDDKLPMRIIAINQAMMASRFGVTIPLDVEHFIPPHWHRSLEISYVKKGGVSLKINNQSQEIYANEFLLVNSGLLHEVSSIANMETDILVFLISYDFLKQTFPDIDTIAFDIERTKEYYPQMVHVFLEIERLYGDGKDYDHLLIIAKLYELMSILNREYKVEKEHASPEYAIAKDVLEIIHVRYQEPITLSELALKFHMSREHFSRIFKKTFGLTFMQYLINYRLYRAFPDIINTKKSIQTISMDHGFPNTKSLITHFKDRYGVTPGQFRKDRRGTIIDHNTSADRQKNHD